MANGMMENQNDSKDTGNLTPAEEQLIFGKYKSMDAAEEGFNNLQKTLDSQGSELGNLRKQVDFFQQQMQATQQKPAQSQESPTPKTDYDKEIKALEKEKKSLDVDDPDYMQRSSDLDSKIRLLDRQKTTEEVLSAAQSHWQKTLEERDAQERNRKFYEQNPDFDSPEMQARIADYIAKDQTGIEDKVSAYRMIQRDDAMAVAQQKQQELEEKERLLSLKRGEESTGTVIRKGGQSTNQKTNTPKAKGKDLDRGMLEALRAVS